METPSSAEHFWDREVVAPTHTSWMEHPRVREYILKSISGSEAGLWPMDWFMRWVGERRFERGLSIGCGTGPLERDVIRKDLVGRIDAFDGSTNSLRVARDTAAAEGLLSRIHYYAADFNKPVLQEKAYDIVFIHQALHHVERLEKLLPAVMQTLTDDGILYLDEYIGPSRTEWNGRRIRPQRAAFDALPREVRRSDVLPLPIQADDPSEAIRSGEIMDRLRIGFDVKAVRGYGGNLLSVLYPSVDFERAPGGIERVIEEEKRILEGGAAPFYAVVVARPKLGAEGARALSTYAALDVISRVRRAMAPRALPQLARRAARRLRKP